MGAAAVGGRGGANDDETLDVLLTVVGTVDDPPIIPALLSPLDRSRNLANESTDVDGIGGGGCTDGSGRMG